MDKLSLTGDQMKKLGYQVVDILVDHFSDLSEKNVTRKKSRQDLEALFREPLPQKGDETTELLNQITSDIFDNIMHLDHPRFFAFVSSPSNYISVLADFLTSGFNVFSGTWLESSAPAQIELVTIGWLTEIFSLPKESSGGLFLSGGSTANLTGLILANHHLRNEGKVGVVYASDQTHSSIERAVNILGKDQLIYRKIRTRNFQIDTDALKKQIIEDKMDGLKSVCIIGNAGTTNTGAVDDFSALHKISEREGTWFHIDGAYGGAAILSEGQKDQFIGIEHADSIGIDPHKWWFQPYEIGCLLVRDRKKLKDAFYILPEYLKDADISEEEINYSNYGIQLTRSFRAFKLWLSLKHFGLEAFSEAVEHGIALAEFTESQVRRYKCWEIVSKAQLGVLNFRYTEPNLSLDELNRVNQNIIDKIVASGYAMISSTVLDGKKVIRLCIINPRTSEEDIILTLAMLNQLAESI